MATHISHKQGLEIAKKIAEARKKQIEEEKKKKKENNGFDSRMEEATREIYRRKIGFDTLDSDNEALMKKLKSNYDKVQSGAYVDPNEIESLLKESEALSKRVNAYNSYVSKYASDNAEAVKSAKEQSEIYSKIYNDLTGQKSFYSNFKDANDYNAQMQAIKERDRLTNNYDLEANKKKLDEMGKTVVKKPTSVLSKLGVSLKNELGATREYDPKAEAEYNRLLEEYNLAKWYQDDAAYDKLLDNEDFEKQSKNAKSTWDVGDTARVADYINGKWYAKAAQGVESAIDFLDIINDNEKVDKYKRYDLMTDDQIKTFNYIYNTEGQKKAQEYLDHLDDAEYGYLPSLYADKNKSKNWLVNAYRALDSGFSKIGDATETIGAAGVDLITRGYDSDKEIEKINAPSNNQLSLAARMQDAGKAENLTYDLLQSMPQIALAMIPSAGFMLQGVVSGANAYADATTEEKNMIERLFYSTGEGLLEYATNKIFGGIGLSKIDDLAGSAGKAVASKLPKIMQPFADTVVTYGIKAGSEAFEEGFQEVVGTAYRNMVLGEDQDVWNWKNIGRAALLGAASAGILNTPSAVGTFTYDLKVPPSTEASYKKHYDIAGEKASASERFSAFLDGINADDIAINTDIINAVQAGNKDGAVKLLDEAIERNKFANDYSKRKIGYTSDVFDKRAEDLVKMRKMVQDGTFNEQAAKTALTQNTMVWELAAQENDTVASALLNKALSNNEIEKKVLKDRDTVRAFKRITGVDLSSYKTVSAKRNAVKSVAEAYQEVANNEAVINATQYVKNNNTIRNDTVRSNNRTAAMKGLGAVLSNINTELTAEKNKPNDQKNVHKIDLLKNEQVIVKTMFDAIRNNKIYTLASLDGTVALNNAAESTIKNAKNKAKAVEIKASETTMIDDIKNAEGKLSKQTRDILSLQGTEGQNIKGEVKELSKTDVIELARQRLSLDINEQKSIVNSTDKNVTSKQKKAARQAITELRTELNNLDSYKKLVVAANTELETGYRVAGESEIQKKIAESEKMLKKYGVDLKYEVGGAWYSDENGNKLTEKEAEEAKKRGETVKKHTKNGYQSNWTVFIMSALARGSVPYIDGSGRMITKKVGYGAGEIRPEKAVDIIIGHELVHFIKRNASPNAKDLYKRIIEKLYGTNYDKSYELGKRAKGLEVSEEEKERYEVSEEAKERYNDLKKLYVAAEAKERKITPEEANEFVSDDYILEEIASDYMGALLSSRGLYDSLARQSGFWGKIAEWIRLLAKKYNSEGIGRENRANLLAQKLESVVKRTLSESENRIAKEAEVAKRKAEEEAARKAEKEDVKAEAKANREALKSPQNEGKAEGKQTPAEAENRADDGERMSVVGINAENADLSALDKAMQMFEDGESNEKIRKETYWWQGKDGKWRYEIADDEMRFERDGLYANPETLEDYIEHDKLFEAYPHLKNIRVKFDRIVDGNPNRKGDYDPVNNIITLKLGRSNDDTKRTLIHEIQHAVQNYEGFLGGFNANGGYIGWFNRVFDNVKETREYKSLKTPEERWDYVENIAMLPGEKAIEKAARSLYRNNYGEIEARTTAERLEMNEEQRRKSPIVNDGNSYSLEKIYSKFVDNLRSMGYTDTQIQEKINGEEKNGRTEEIGSGTRGRNANGKHIETDRQSAQNPRNINSRGEGKNQAHVYSGGVKYSLSPETDSDYLSAVENGDMEKAQKMVEEAARANGYNSPLLYHGTEQKDFTKIKTTGVEEGMEWSPFFATNSIKTAGTYSGTTQKTSINEPINEDELFDAKWDDLYEAESAAFNKIIRAEHLDEWSISQDTIHDVAFEYAEKVRYGYISRDDAWSSLYEELIDMVASAYMENNDFVDFAEWQDSVEGEKIGEALEGIVSKTLSFATFLDEKAGNYSLYANTDNMLEVDGGGSLWSNIKSEYGRSTRAIAKNALEQGYKGVIIRNIVDEGRYGGGRDTADVYIFFNPESQVKSADPVTYDDNGNVIPLSERFNEGNEDIRYSLSGYTADGIEVYETSEEIMNMSEADRKKHYLELVKNDYRGRTARFQKNGHTYYAGIDVDDAKKQMYGEKRSSKSGSKALVRTLADGSVFDLVENSTYDHGAKEQGKQLKSHDGVVGWDYFVKTVQIDGKVYDLVADVRKKKDGEYVYTLHLTDNTKIKAAPAQTRFSGPSKVAETAYDNIVTQDNGVVNTQSMQNSENDTDGRMSETVETLESDTQSYDELVAETEANKKKNSDLVKKFIAERGTLEGTTVDSFLKEFLDSYKSETWYGKVAAKYKDAFDKIYNSGEVDPDAVTSAFREVAALIYDGTTENEIETLVKDIHSTEIKVPQTVKESFGKEWNDFRTKNFGNLALRNDKGQSISEVYAKLSKDHSELFSDEITDEAEQLKKIAKVCTELRGELKNRVYNEAQASAIESITTELIEGTMSLDPQVMYSYNKNNKTKEYYKKKIEGLKKANQEWTDKVLEKIASKSERQKIAYDKKMAYKRLSELGKALFAPTKDHHIPEDMRNDVAAFFKKIVLPRTTVAEIEFDNRIQSYLNQNSLGDKADFESLPSSVAAEIKDISKFDLATFDSKRMHEFSQLVRMLAQAINQENKLYHSSKDASDIVSSAVRNIMIANGDRKKISKFIGTIADLIGMSAWDPEGLFNYIDIPELYDAYLEITKGQDAYADNLKYFSNKMAEIVKGKIPKEWRENVVEIGLENGKKLSFTGTQIMTLYLLNKQADSRKRLLDENGGIQLTKNIIKVGKKPGKYVVPAENTSLTQNDLDNILSDKYLTEDMKKVAEDISGLLNGDISDRLNEVSLKLDGYKRFGIADYFPMTVADMAKQKDGTFDLMGAQYEALKIAKGFTFDRTGTSGVMLVVDDIFNVMDRHILGASQYIGYESALRDFMKIWTGKYNNQQLRDAVSRRMSEKVAKAVDNFVLGIQGRQMNVGDEHLLSEKLLSNYKAAQVALNFSVVAKQPMSIIRAMPEFSKKGIWAMRGKVTKADTEQMLKHSGLANMKNWGFSENTTAKTLGQLYDENALNWRDKMNSLHVFNWAEKADMHTWTRIWNACVAETGSIEEATNKFNDVIRKTQVVDTATTSSPIAKANAFTKIVYAFKNEPLKTFNYTRAAIQDVIRGKKGAVKHLRNVLLANAVNTALVAAVTTAFSMMRDEEDDDLNEFFERLFENAKADALDTMLIFLGDAMSAVDAGKENRTVERTDLAVITDTVQIVDRIINGNYGGDNYRTFLQGVYDASAVVSSATGIPVKTALRYLKTTLYNVVSVADNPKRDYFVEKMFYNVDSDKSQKQFKSILTDALNKDYKMYAYIKNDLVKHGYGQSNIDDAVKASDRFVDSWNEGPEAFRKALNEAQKYDKMLGSEYVIASMKAKRNDLVTKYYNALLNNNTDAAEKTKEKILAFRSPDTKRMTTERELDTLVTDELEKAVKSDIKDMLVAEYGTPQWQMAVNELLEKYGAFDLITEKYIDKVARNLK